METDGLIYNFVTLMDKGLLCIISPSLKFECCLRTQACANQATRFALKSNTWVLNAVYFIRNCMSIIFNAYFCSLLHKNEYSTGAPELIWKYLVQKSFVLNLVGTIFKNRTFSRLCSKIWLGHVHLSPYVPAPLPQATWLVESWQAWNWFVSRMR